ncbi:MAG: hypothetical protein AAGG80_04740, partial [Pseudomonadota bacterium]
MPNERQLIEKVIGTKALNEQNIGFTVIRSGGILHDLKNQSIQQALRTQEQLEDGSHQVTLTGNEIVEIVDPKLNNY